MALETTPQRGTTAQVSPRAGLRAPQPTFRKRALTPYMFILPFGVLFLLFFIVPILYAIYQSLFRSERSGLGRGTVLWSIANIATWAWAGYNMLIIFAALQAIPTEIYESARLDGCSGFRIAWYIKIPLVAPALILTCIFSIIGTLQLFNEPSVLTTISNNISTSYTPNLYAYNTAFGNNNYYYAAAMAVALALVTCVLSFGFLRVTQ